MRNRTADLLDANETLYQLSYSPESWPQDNPNPPQSRNMPDAGSRPLRPLSDVAPLTGRRLAHPIGDTEPMDEQTHEHVREIVASVPAGQVATYGDVAAVAGLPTPRLVGRVLKEDGFDLPWHRIIRASGIPADHLRSEQLARLRTEGVLAEEGRVDLRRHRWRPAAC